MRYKWNYTKTFYNRFFFIISVAKAELITCQLCIPPRASSHCSLGQDIAIITNLFIVCVHFALSLSISGDRATLLIKEKVSQLIYRVHYGVKGTSPI